MQGNFRRLFLSGMLHAIFFLLLVPSLSAVAFLEAAKAGRLPPLINIFSDRVIVHSTPPLLTLPPLFSLFSPPRCRRRGGWPYRTKEREKQQQGKYFIKIYNRQFQKNPDAIAKLLGF